MQAAGISALIVAAVAALAPQAAAKDLAPGVSCSGYSCRNDTDDTYRVSWILSCSSGVKFGSTTWVRPHSSRALRTPCPAEYKPGFGEEFGKWVPAHPIGAEYVDAVVDNEHSPDGDSGSAH